MPCHSAMIGNILIVNPDEAVEDVIKKMKDKKKPSETAVIVDEGGKMLGYFTMKVLLRNLLPVSLSLQNSAVGNDVMVGAAPGIAKRLFKVKPIAISQVMERKFSTLAPDTPTWEGVQALVEHGSPIFVIEEGTEKFVGAMDEDSTIAELERIQNKQEKGKANAVSK